MAAWPDVFPPCFAALAIVYGEVAFPDRLIERNAEDLKLLLINPATNIQVVKRSMKDLARGWQITVDLVYTLLASVTVLVTSVWRQGISRGPVFVILVFLFLLNVGLLLRCAVIGPEETATIGVQLPFRFLATHQPIRYFLTRRPIRAFLRGLRLSWYPTLRQISIFFVLAANALLFAAALISPDNPADTPNIANPLTTESKLNGATLDHSKQPTIPTNFDRK